MRRFREEDVPRDEERREDDGRQGGYSLLEMMATIVVLGVMACAGIGAFQRIREQSASESLLRTLEGLLGEARLRAVAGATHVAVRFGERDGAVYARLYRDGDGDGVRADDVRRGTDRPLGPEVLLRQDQSRVAVPEDAATDPLGNPTNPRDPVRFGRGDTLSFSPTATATPGTLYLAEGDGRSGWAVRVAGLDGRVRLWRWKRGRWTEVQAL